MRPRQPRTLEIHAGMVRHLILPAFIGWTASYCYGSGSIPITTNRGIKEWPELLAGDAVPDTAILDRLLHHNHVLNIKGRSYLPTPRPRTAPQLKAVNRPVRW